MVGAGNGDGDGGQSIGGAIAGADGSRLGVWGGSGLMGETPLPYSSDELAVLAESFLNQGFQGAENDGLEGVDDWWNVGNL